MHSSVMTSRSPRRGIRAFHRAVVHDARTRPHHAHAQGTGQGIPHCTPPGRAFSTVCRGHGTLAATLAWDSIRYVTAIAVVLEKGGSHDRQAGVGGLRHDSLGRRPPGPRTPAWTHPGYEGASQHRSLPEPPPLVGRTGWRAGAWAGRPRRGPICLATAGARRRPARVRSHPRRDVGATKDQPGERLAVTAEPHGRAGCASPPTAGGSLGAKGETPSPLSFRRNPESSCGLRRVRMTWTPAFAGVTH